MMTDKSLNQKLTFVFDIGNVLIDWNPNYLYRKMFDGNQAEIDAFLREVCTVEWNAKQDTGYPIARAVEERVRLFPEYEEPIRAFYGRWDEMIKGEISGTVEILADLRDRGYPLYALSNWSAETFVLVREQFDFFDWFEDMVISGEVGLIKPDLPIFELLLQRVGRPAEACLFIDDHLPNIETARSMGFQTVHFKSPEGLREVLRERGVV